MLTYVKKQAKKIIAKQEGFRWEVSTERLGCTHIPSKSLEFLSKYDKALES